ncbi:MAG: hypothetical protein FWD75_11200 [Propionibacteriaceae bacterium]|nr:hypothetical protein [Propionibacteriaceae bacterium]
MTFSAIADEARRNVMSGTTRAGLGFVVLAVMVSLFALADLLTIAGAQATVAHYVGADAATRAITSSHGIDGRRCDALAGVSTIDASGALAGGAPVHFLAMPTVAVQTFHASPGFATVLGVTDPAPTGVWVEAGLATVISAHVGDQLATDRGALHIAGIFTWPQDGRDQRLTFAILIPQLDATSFDECWIQAWPVVDANDIMLRATVNPTSSLGAVGQINTSLGSTLDAHALFTSRLTRFVPLLCLITGLAVGYAMTRRRRLEYASALHAGQTKSSQLLTCLVETLFWSLSATFVSIVFLWHTATMRSPTSALPVLAITCRGPLLGLSGAVLGALASCALARERDLFRLFKNR